MQDAQEAKKGKKKKPKKKKGEDRAPQEDESPSGASLAEAHHSSLPNGNQGAALKPDQPSAEGHAEAELPSKLTSHHKEEKLGRAESDSVNVSTEQAVMRSSSSTDVPNTSGAEAGSTAAVLRQKGKGVSAALSSKASPRAEITKVPPSPQRNHVRAAGRRAVDGSSAGTGGSKLEWVSVPDHNPLEQKAEWQAAGGRKAKRSTAGKAYDSAPLQPVPEPAPANLAKMPKAARAGKGAQLAAQASGHGEEVRETAAKTLAAPRSSSRDEQPGPGQPSQGAAPGRATIGKAGKAARAEGKRMSPTKATRDAATAPEQQGRVRKASERQVPGGATLSFADMARPAAALKLGEQASSAPAGHTPNPMPAQEGGPGQGSAQMTQSVPASHGAVAKPRSLTTIPAPRPSTTNGPPQRPQPSRPDNHRASAPPHWQAAQSQVVHDPQPGPLDRRHVQPASTVPLSASPAGTP